MLTYQHTAVTVLDRYDILYGGHRSDAGVGSERRRRFLDSNGFRFSTTLRNVIVTELRDSVVFLEIQTSGNQPGVRVPPGVCEDILGET
jgi:hypothetical protein